MGDAARQLPHGFHLLRLAELLLEVALIADVALGAPHAHQLPVLQEADDIIKENARPAVPRPLSGFGIGQPIARPDKAANLFSIGGVVDIVEIAQPRADELGRLGVAVHARHGVVALGNPRPLVQPVD